MREVGAFEAKTHLSALLEAVEADEEVLITRRGKPVARLVPARPARVRFGSLKGIVAPPSDDIFAPMGEDELRAGRVSDRAAARHQLLCHGAERRPPAA